MVIRRTMIKMIPKKVIVAGSRTFNDYDLLERTLGDIFGNDEIEIVSGCAQGADTLAEKYATIYGLDLHKFPADWNKYNKRAGYIRNKQMADFSDYLIAFWDGESKGTRMMIDIAREQGLGVKVVFFNNKK